MIRPAWTDAVFIVGIVAVVIGAFSNSWVLIAGIVLTAAPLALTIVRMARRRRSAAGKKGKGSR